MLEIWVKMFQQPPNASTDRNLHCSLLNKKRPQKLILLVLKPGGALKCCAHACGHWKKPKKVHVRQYLHISVKSIRKQECLWPSQKTECKEWFGLTSYRSPNLKYFIFGFQFHNAIDLASPVQVQNKLFACCAGIKNNNNKIKKQLSWLFSFISIYSQTQPTNTVLLHL